RAGRRFRAPGRAGRRPAGRSHPLPAGRADGRVRLRREPLNGPADRAPDAAARAGARRRVARREAGCRGAPPVARPGDGAPRAGRRRGGLPGRAAVRARARPAGRRARRPPAAVPARSHTVSGRGEQNGARKTARRVPPAEVARQAAAELAELLSRPAEAIVSLDRAEDGWHVGVEVLEMRRVPDTADVLAEYEVVADERGGLVGYHR